MSLLHCSHCAQPISATHKICPHCGRKVSFFSDIKAQVEHNRLWQAALVIVGVSLMGAGWFWRMDSGDRWPLYIILVAVAPLVPWLLKLAYKNAAPSDEELDAAARGSEGQTEDSAPGSAVDEVKGQVLPGAGLGTLKSSSHKGER